MERNGRFDGCDVVIGAELDQSPAGNSKGEHRDKIDTFLYLCDKLRPAIRFARFMVYAPPLYVFAHIGCALASHGR